MKKHHGQSLRTVALAADRIGTRDSWFDDSGVNSTERLSSSLLRKMRNDFHCSATPTSTAWLPNGEIPLEPVLDITTPYSNSLMPPMHGRFYV